MSARCQPGSACKCSLLAWDEDTVSIDCTFPANTHNTFTAVHVGVKSCHLDANAVRHTSPHRQISMILSLVIWRWMRDWDMLLIVDDRMETTHREIELVMNLVIPFKINMWFDSVIFTHYKRSRMVQQDLLQ